MTTFRIGKCTVAAFGVSLLLQTTAMAIATRRDASTGTTYPWNNKWACGSWQDKEMVDAGVVGWFLPVGPTGVRALISDKHPCYFTVKYVFKNSPAAGKVKAGDIIVGANGEVLSRPHRFGRRHIFGWDGPMMDMAKLIEDSQGKDGELELLVWPGGDKAKLKKVMVRIEPIGRFSPTYPYDCPRSDTMITRLCDYLVKVYEREGGFKKQVHTHSHCVLALMASGDRKYVPLIKRIVSGYARKRYDPNNGGGFPCWGAGYDGIIMGEYYLRYRDSSLLPAMQSLAKFYEDACNMGNGGFHHKPYPAILQRVSAGGPTGYGGLACAGGLPMVAQSLFREAGLPYSEKLYQRTHQAYLQAARPEVVTVGYNIPGWPGAIISVKDPNKARSPRGAGYLVPTGMKDIGEYEVVYPRPGLKGGHVWVWNQAKKAAREAGKDDVHWWVKDDSIEKLVYDVQKTQLGKYAYQGMNTRWVIRVMPPLPEPTRPYNTTDMCAQGGVGLGALAHLIGNKGNKSWEYLGTHAANSCALGHPRWFDGHAAGSIHQLWVALGAARADKAKARAFLDGIKWWLIMQQTHDGGYLVCPNRDRPSGCNTDPYYGAYNLATANAVLFLALSRRQLQITGAPSTRDGSGPVEYSSGSSSRPGGSPSGRESKPRPVPARATPAVPKVDARIMSQFDAALIARIKAALTSGVKPKFYLRMVRGKARLNGVDWSDGNGSLVVETMRPRMEMKVQWKRLTLTDKRALALVLLRQGTPEDHALVAFYSLATGDRDTAFTHLASAGQGADAVREAFKSTDE